MKEAFTYCWTDRETNKLYIGAHKGQTDDGYVCSSKLMLQEYAIRKDDFTREIIAHGSWEGMLSFETTLLQGFDVRNDEGFYNKHNGEGKFKIGPLTEEHKRKIGLANKGNKRPDLSKWNRENPFHGGGSHDPLKNGMYGKKHSEESIKQISTNRKGKGRQPKSTETKQKMREAALRRWEKIRGSK